MNDLFLGSEWYTWVSFMNEQYELCTVIVEAHAFNYQQVICKCYAMGRSAHMKAFQCCGVYPFLLQCTYPLAPLQSLSMNPVMACHVSNPCPFLDTFAYGIFPVLVS